MSANPNIKPEDSIEIERTFIVMGGNFKPEKTKQGIVHKTKIILDYYVGKNKRIRFDGLLKANSRKEVNFNRSVLEVEAVPIIQLKESASDIESTEKTEFSFEKMNLLNFVEMISEKYADIINGGNCRPLLKQRDSYTVSDFVHIDVDKYLDITQFFGEKSAKIPGFLTQHNTELSGLQKVDIEVNNVKNPNAVIELVKKKLLSNFNIYEITAQEKIIQQYFKNDKALQPEQIEAMKKSLVWEMMYGTGGQFKKAREEAFSKETKYLEQDISLDFRVK